MKPFLKVITLISILIFTSNCSQDSDETKAELPTISTKGISNLSANSVKCGGHIISDGGNAIIEKGLVYSTNPDPSLDDSITNAGSGKDDYVLRIDSLLPNTTYYVKSFATTKVGTAYGQQVTFTTLDLVLAAVRTVSVQDVTNTSAVIVGEITNAGNSAITSKGVVWSTNPNPTISDNVKADVSTTNTFSIALQNLNRNTTYYVRAFITNELGTSYGDEITFETLDFDNYLMFSTSGQIYSQVLHNTQDKILYFFTYDFNAGFTSNFKLIAYDYLNNTVIQQKPIDPFDRLSANSHSIGRYNNQLELYIVSSNTISILNPVTLQIIDTIALPTSRLISSVEQKNGLLFIGYNISGTGDSKLGIYSRNTLSLIRETPIASNCPEIFAYNDLISPNQIKCLSIPQFSSQNYFEVETYDSNGNHLSHNTVTDYEGGSVRTKDSGDFLVKGRYGRIYFKNSVHNSSLSMSPTGTLTDCKIGSGGNYFYSIQNNFNSHYKILKHNTANFEVDSFIPIIEMAPKYLFIDNNDYLIIDYNSTAAQKQVFLSVYR